MSEDLDLSRMIAYCAHLGMLYSDRRLRGAGYDVTPVQSRVLVYLSCCGGAVNQRDLERELHLRRPLPAGEPDGGGPGAGGGVPHRPGGHQPALHRLPDGGGAAPAGGPALPRHRKLGK